MMFATEERPAGEEFGSAVTYSTAAFARSAPAALSFADVAGGILARLRTVVEAGPDAVAVTDAQGELTFADLAGRAGAVAEALQADDEPGRPVAMLCGHDRQAVATMLGALLSGHPLLVLDPLTPVPRLRSFLERLGAQVCLADAVHDALAAATVEGLGRVVRSPAENPGSEHDRTRLWRRPLDPAGVAALGFTSGSTGNPKVVALDHRHLVGDAWAGSSVDDCVRVGDVMAHSLPMAFAAGTNAILTGVLSGATTALYDVRSRGIADLAGWIEQNGVSVVHASPAILRALVAAAPDPRLLASLRSLTTAGEAAHGRDVAAARALLPPTCTVFHRFGSTETGLIAHFRLGPGDPTPDGPLPVGRPIGATRVDLVDEGRSPPGNRARCGSPAPTWPPATGTTRRAPPRRSATTRTAPGASSAGTSDGWTRTGSCG